jgi:MFS family permease
VLAGELIFFLPFVFARVFRPTLLEVFGITNLQLGTYFSIYGIVAMFSYILGGPIADKFSSRNLISIALIATSFGGFVLAYLPIGVILPWAYAWWGFTTIFLFWAALIKSTRLWGGDFYQGKAFGFLEGGRGLTAALISSAALFLLSDFSSVNDHDIDPELRIATYQNVMFLSSCLIGFIGILIRIILPLNKTETPKNKVQIDRVAILQLIKIPELWLLSLIIISAYAGYKITDVFSLYAKDVMGYSEYKAAEFGTIMLWLRPLFAIIAGVMADKFTSRKTLFVLFLILLSSSLFLTLLPNGNMVLLPFVGLISTLIGVYGIRAIYFALVQESNIPLNVTGAAVGIVSFVGFTPDVFISPLIGYLIDTYHGLLGYQYVFAVLSLFGIIGAISSITLLSHINRVNNSGKNN